MKATSLPLGSTTRMPGRLGVRLRDRAGRGVDGHPVAPFLVTEVDARPLWAVHESVGTERERIDLHPSFRWLRGGGVDAIGAVVVIGDVERCLIRTDGDAVWLLDVVSHLDDRPVGLQPIDGAFSFGVSVPR